MEPKTQKTLFTYHSKNICACAHQFKRPKLSIFHVHKPDIKYTPMDQDLFTNIENPLQNR